LGFRFRKSFSLGKGLRLNLSKSGMSMSAGKRSASVSVGPRGAFTNLGIPGTGLSYRSQVASRTSSRYTGSTVSGGASSFAGAFGCLGAVLSLIGLILLVAGSFGSGFGLAAIGVSLVVVYITIARANEEQKRQRESERRADLVARFGEDTAARILAGEMWLAQTAEQLRESLGEPVDVDQKVMKTKTREVWKYDQTGANRFNLRVTLENGLVTEWDRK
jgi:membrane protein implicated in regulation of membrane protease activity